MRYGADDVVIGKVHAVIIKILDANKSHAINICRNIGSLFSGINALCIAMIAFPISITSRFDDGKNGAVSSIGIFFIVIVVGIFFRSFFRAKIRSRIHIEPIIVYLRLPRIFRIDHFVHDSPRFFAARLCGNCDLRAKNWRNSKLDVLRRVF